MDKFYDVTVYPEASKSVNTPLGYPAQLGFDNYWGQLPEIWYGYHDQYMAGAKNGIDGIWNYLMPEDANATFWRSRVSGSGTNGAPIHTIDHAAPNIR